MTASVKMQANMLLAGVGALALASYPWAQGNIVMNLVHHTALAAAIGGLADWWGVTAIFARPLNIPAPGTDMLRARYDELQAALGDMEAYKYLSDLLVHISEERKDEELCDWLLAKIAQLARAEETRAYIRRQLQKALREKKEKSLWSRFTTWLGEKLDVVNLDDAEAAICQALINGADRLQQDSEWRSWFIEQVRRIFYALYSRREWQQFVSLLQNKAVADVELAPALKQLMDNMIKILCRPVVEGQEALTLATPLARSVAEALALIEEQLKRSEKLRTELEKYLQHLLSLLLLWLQHRLGELISRIMQAMSDTKLSEVVRSKVDRDMQNIRLNGTCMGALIGLVIYIMKCSAINSLSLGRGAERSEAERGLC